MYDQSLCFQPASQLAALIRRRELSAVELMHAQIAQIDRHNPAINALVTLVPEQALAAAAATDAALARGEALGPLAGLPVAHKDLVETAGIRTTYGSPIFASHVPTFDALIVQRLRAAGAITLAKSNTPEFGAGSQTFNPVFGPTRNPYDLRMTVGGSSGGAAAALASGMIPIADGSDFGGSLRNPAGYCNVIGLRPSPGRVPSWPDATPFSPLAVEGPMARTVSDIALLLQAIAGPDRRDPRSFYEPASLFASPLARDLRGLRIAWAPFADGSPIDPQIAALIEAQRTTFEALGCRVEEAFPQFAAVDETFMTLRAWRYELAMGELLDRERPRLKETVVWNIEQGRQLSGPEVGRATRDQAAIFHTARAFMEEYDAIVLPTAAVPPFPVEQPFVDQIAGVQMPNYIAWMRCCYLISLTGLPTLSLPCGFTADGLPVGLQLVGRYADELSLLQLAYGYEQAHGGFAARPPAL